MLQQGLFILLSLCDFRQVFVHYLMSILMISNKATNKRVTTFIKQSLENSSLLPLFQKSDRPERFPLIARNNWIVLAVPWSVKYFFAPNSPIFWKIHGWEEEVKEGGKSNCKALCFSSKCNSYGCYHGFICFL